jgi:hypothetical protein
MVVGLVAVILPSLPSARIFTCLHGIELGMSPAGVMDALKTTVSEDEMLETNDGFCAATSDNDLFRHARYRFNDKGTLAQIELTIREVRGRDEVVKELDRAYHLNLSDDAVVVREGVALSLDGNTLIIRNAASLSAKSHAKRGPTRLPTSR